MPFPFSKNKEVYMLRMNREKSNTIKFKVKSFCANYNSNTLCSGCMIGEHLQQWVDSSKVNKKCLLLDGNECDYYNRCIAPLEGLK